MSGFGGRWPEVLAGAVAAGRSVLRNLDIKEIPSPLARVAAYQGGRLPPPLAAALLREIDENEWFREKVAGDWDGGEDDPAGPFLNRSPGWWLTVAEAVGAAMAGSEDRQLQGLQADLAKTEAKRAAAVRKAKEHKREAERVRRDAKAAVEAARNAAEAKVSSELGAASSVREELVQLKAELVQLQEDHHRLLEAFATLRGRFARDRAGGSAETKSGGMSGSLPSDPVRLARMLDLQAAEFGRNPDRGSEAATAAPSAERLLLDPGIRPDSADAMRWLIGLERPAVVLVDGYNAQFHVDRADFSSGAARRHLIEALKRLRTISAAKHRFVVVYDSTLPGERVARTSLGGVEVRFAPEDRIADEEIVDLASHLQRVVVISSDRAVREGAEADGALVLWSEALAEWLERR